MVSAASAGLPLNGRTATPRRNSQCDSPKEKNGAAGFRNYGQNTRRLKLGRIPIQAIAEHGQIHLGEASGCGERIEEIELITLGQCFTAGSEVESAAQRERVTHIQEIRRQRPARFVQLQVS